MSEEKAKRVVKSVKLNCVQRQILFSAMFSVYAKAASGLVNYRMMKVDEALDLDEIVEWEAAKMSMIRGRFDDWKKAGGNSPLPSLNREEEFGEEREYKFSMPLFEFVQDFLSKMETYPTNLRKQVASLHDKFGIRYEASEEGEEVVEEVTSKDYKVINEG